MTLSELHDTGQRRREHVEECHTRENALRGGVEAALTAGATENNVRERIAVDYKMGLFQRITVLSQQGARDAIAVARDNDSQAWTKAGQPSAGEALQRIRELARDLAVARLGLHRSNVELVRLMWDARRQGAGPTEVVAASGLSTHTGFDWLAAQERHDRISKVAERVTDAVMVLPFEQHVQLKLIVSSNNDDDGPSNRDVDRLGLDRAIEDWFDRRWSELQDALAAEGYTLGAQDSSQYVLVTEQK